MHKHRLPFVFTDGILPKPLTSTKQNQGNRSCPVRYVWLGGRDSNPDRRIQSPQSYR